MTGDDLVSDLTGPVEPESAERLVLVHGPVTAPAELVLRALDRLATLPCVVAALSTDPAIHDPASRGLTTSDVPTRDLVDAASLPLALAESTATLPGLADLVVTSDEVGDLETTVAQAPMASAALALHLRAADRRPPLDGLVAESGLFSTLQAGPDHAVWLATHERPHRGDVVPAPPIRVRRDGDVLHITLDRPHVRNAVSATLRDELLDALAVAEADPTLAVHLRGAGPDFCAGGDLDEFGTTPDPATGHLIRTRRSLAAVLHRIAPRMTAHVHGAALGAGIELAAFAGEVRATADARFGLPELGLGLVPGAGGTVSLPRRIGRQRTTWLALTRRTIDAPTALGWGLVDEIVPGSQGG